jgi:hypothetical protein
MAVNVSNTTTTNTFEYWRLRTNQMANLFREKAVTTNSNTTPGSASVTGTLSGSNLNANGTAQSTSITTGSLQSKGGLGVSRNAHIGGKLVVTGISNTANLNVAGTATATLFSGNGSSLTSVDAKTIGGKDFTDFVSNTFAVATFASNNYIQSDTFKTNLGVVSNNYVQGRYTSNNFVKSTFTSNNYLQSRFTSNNYVSTRVGLRATNTYVKSTFTSNNYVQNRFGSNNYIKNTFVSNSFVTDSFLRSDTTDTVTGVLTFSAETKFTSIANVATGNISLPNTANISIAGMDSNSNRVNGDGTSLVFSDSSIANTGDIGDIQINYGSISNADVLVYDENTQKFVNRPRSLIDVTSVDDIDDVNIVKSKGDLLVRVVNTTDGTTFAGTSNGFITGRLDSMNETELTGLTANAVSFTSTSNSFVQVFVNGVRLGNADFVTTTSQVKLVDELVATDVISIVEFNPHAFSVGDGTPSDLNQLNYSDLRLKTSIEPYTASSTILDVETYTYQWKDTVRFNNRTEIGFIAQDLEKYVPELVVENETGEKMVDYGKMTTVLLSTIKQLNKRVEALESKTFCTCPEE